MTKRDNTYIAIAIICDPKAERYIEYPNYMRLLSEKDTYEECVEQIEKITADSKEGFIFFGNDVALMLQICMVDNIGEEHLVIVIDTFLFDFKEQSMGFKKINLHNMIENGVEFKDIYTTFNLEIPPNLSAHIQH